LHVHGALTSSTVWGVAGVLAVQELIYDRQATQLNARVEFLQLFSGGAMPRHGGGRVPALASIHRLSLRVSCGLSLCLSLSRVSLSLCVFAAPPPSLSFSVCLCVFCICTARSRFLEGTLIAGLNWTEPDGQQSGGAGGCCTTCTGNKACKGWSYRGLPGKQGGACSVMWQCKRDRQTYRESQRVSESLRESQRVSESLRERERLSHRAIEHCNEIAMLRTRHVPHVFLRHEARCVWQWQQLVVRQRHQRGRHVRRPRAYAPLHLWRTRFLLPSISLVFLSPSADLAVI
jgi:hypothetical protein